jgi:hypothetical protein
MVAAIVSLPIPSPVPSIHRAYSLSHFIQI